MYFATNMGRSSQIIKIKCYKSGVNYNLARHLLNANHLLGKGLKGRLMAFGLYKLIITWALKLITKIILL